MHTDDVRILRKAADALESVAAPISWAEAAEVLDEVFERGLISVYHGYALRRDGRKDATVLASNWNDVSLPYPAPVYRLSEPSKAMSRICAALERIDGIELEWSDEGSSCDDCGRWVRTEPDNYFWEPRHVVSGGELFCHRCACSRVPGYLSKFRKSVTP